MEAIESKRATVQASGRPFPRRLRLHQDKPYRLAKRWRAGGSSERDAPWDLRAIPNLL